jgi:hypothetical protein
MFKFSPQILPLNYIDPPKPPSFSPYVAIKVFLNLISPPVLAVMYVQAKEKSQMEYKVTRS